MLTRAMTLLAAALLCAGAAAAPKEGPAIVVLTFDSTLKEKDDRGELLADLLTEGLGKHFTVVERKELKKILAEQELSLKGLVSAKEAVGVGKLTGAKLLLAGKMTRLGDDTIVNIRVIHVESGRFKGLTVKVPGQPDFDQIVKRTIEEVGKQLPKIQEELVKASE